MGCDIHLFVERRDNARAPWAPVLVRSTCSWCAGSGVGRDDRECYGCKGTKLEAGYGSRNYHAFAVLAGVRNEDDARPIAEPRGLPVDMSDELQRVRAQSESDDDDDGYDRRKQQYGCAWFGDHSWSHLTLSELLAYDWDARVTIAGIVTPDGFAHYAKHGYPGGYCRGVDGSAVQMVSLRAMRAIAEGGTFSDVDHPFDGRKLLSLTPRAAEVLEREGLYWNKSVRGEHAEGLTTILGERRVIYANLEWERSVKDVCGDFCTRFIPALKDAATSGTDNLRIVFGFDS